MRIGIKKYAIRADIELILNTFAISTHINNATIPIFRLSDKITPNPVDLQQLTLQLCIDKIQPY